jgi:hypothetical protein
LPDVFDVDEDGKVEVNFAKKNLDMKLKDLRDANMQQWAKLIANPDAYSVESIDEFRRNIAMCAAVLMEHNVKIEIPTKERTPEDVLKESMGELGMMLGSKAFAGGLNFFRRVKEDIMDVTSTYEEDDDDDFEIFEDDEGYYYYDESGNAIACDVDGNPLE